MGLLFVYSLPCSWAEDSNHPNITSTILTAKCSFTNKKTDFSSSDCSKSILCSIFWNCTWFLSYASHWMGRLLIVICCTFLALHGEWYILDSHQLFHKYNSITPIETVLNIFKIVRYSLDQVSRVNFEPLASNTRVHFFITRTPSLDGWVERRYINDIYGVFSLLVTYCCFQRLRSCVAFRAINFVLYWYRITWKAYSMKLNRLAA